MGWFGPSRNSTISGNRRSKPSNREEEDDEEYEDDDNEEEEEEDDGNYTEDPKKTCAFQYNYGEFDSEDIYPGEKDEGWNCDLTQNQTRCRKEICPLWKNVNGTRKTDN